MPTGGTQKTDGNPEGKAGFKGAKRAQAKAQALGR